jgi:putative oxidoreductase
MRYAVLSGRILYSAIFVLSASTHFSPETIAAARQAGVPLAEIAVPMAGLMAAAGGLSVLLGYRARIGATLIAIFLIGVTPALHDFWTVTDPAMRQVQLVMFLKNVSMLGAALGITYFGSGPLSLDERSRRRSISGGALPVSVRA